MRAASVVQQFCKSCRTCFKFYCMFYFTCDRSFSRNFTAMSCALANQQRLLFGTLMHRTEESSQSLISRCRCWLLLSLLLRVCDTAQRRHHHTQWLQFTPCLKKLCKFRLRPIVKFFGTKIAKRTSFFAVYSFSTSSILCQRSERTTVLNADVPNCYITQ